MNIEILFSKNRRIRNTLLAALLAICLVFSKDADSQIKFNNSDNLTATDALGRKLPGYNQVGELRKDKFVGMFYFLWQTRNADNNPNNIPEILSKDPKAIDDYHNSIWPNSKDNRWYWWSEPLFGYYRNTDEWVLRKHAEMLADANVDVVIFDCSNGDTWEEAYPVLCKVFLQARKDGVKAPQIAFLLPFGPGENGRKEKIKLYNELYKPGLYKDLWFYWKGKPLILSYPDDLTDDPKNPAISKLYREIRNFFTFRPCQSVYDKGPNRPDQWGWLQIFPQHGFVNKDNGTFEEVTVGVSQNWSKERGVGAMSAPGNFGRSYTNKTGHTTDSNAINYGLNFQEQWDRALQLDPEFIFVTSWNEWLVGRQELWQQQTNAFADAFNQENSRDIEPMKGGHSDNYYYQLVSNIRRFKGMRPPLKPSSKTTIKIDGGFTKWDNVMPIFTSYKNNTDPRYSPGWQNYFYKNNSGRNDIIIFEESVQLPETKDEDGFGCEDVHLLTVWVNDLLVKIEGLQDVLISVINFSTYGASFVYVDREGKPIAPLYNYLNPFPEKLKEDFYDKYGGESVFSQTTASPVLGSLNSGLQLYRLKYEQPVLALGKRWVQLQK